LNRQFATSRPNERWVTDITYIWTNEGWCYLAAILDLFSRRRVGARRDAKHELALAGLGRSHSPQSTDARTAASFRPGLPNQLEKEHAAQFAA
jgi:putative transposase